MASARKSGFNRKVKMTAKTSATMMLMVYRFFRDWTVTSFCRVDENLPIISAPHR